MRDPGSDHFYLVETPKASWRRRHGSCLGGFPQEEAGVWRDEGPVLPRLSVGKEHVLCFPSLVQTSAFVSHSMGFMAVALEVSKCLVLVSGPTEPVVQGPL